jgi:hypothetical protein
VGFLQNTKGATVPEMAADYCVLSKPPSANYDALRAAREAKYEQAEKAAAVSKKKPAAASPKEKAKPDD